MRFTTLIAIVSAAIAFHARGDDVEILPRAVWSGADKEGRITIELRANRTCAVTVARPAGESEKWVSCRYWIHGGRVRLRGWGEKAGEGLGALEIEHLREADTLVILGETSKVLYRQWDY